MHSPTYMCLWDNTLLNENGVSIIIVSVWIAWQTELLHLGLARLPSGYSSNSCLIPKVFQLVFSVCLKLVIK